MVEVYKFLHSDSPEIMNEIFNIQRNIYNLRSFNIFQTNIPRSNRYGLNSIPYRANQLWKILPENIKSSQSLSCFKDKIKNWCCNNCPCTICKTFIPNLGYLWCWLLLCFFQSVIFNIFLFLYYCRYLLAIKLYCM